MTFGEKLSALRRQNNYTQEQLADALGVSRQAVSKWESNTAYPETEKLVRLCKMFDCSLDNLVLDRPEPQTAPAPAAPDIPDPPAEEKASEIPLSENRIFIECPRTHTLVSCCKVTASPVLRPTDKQPQYLLRGIDQITAFGEHATQLGWYASKEDVEREIADISDALRSGKNCYTLQYDIEIEYSMLGTVLKKVDNTDLRFSNFRIRERKSEKTLFGMPLWHIGRNARGVVALGIHARGLIAVGLRAEGILSCGLLSAGVLSFGLLASGLLAIGMLAVGIAAAGAIALGILAAGAICLGIFATGAVAIGDFAIGALALGRYIALGDHARGLIAIGDSAAAGSVIEQLGGYSLEQVHKILYTLDNIVPTYLNWAKELFKWLWMR